MFYKFPLLLLLLLLLLLIIFIFIIIFFFTGTYHSRSTWGHISIFNRPGRNRNRDRNSKPAYQGFGFKNT